MAQAVDNKFLQDLSQLYSSKELSDFVLVSSDGKEFHVHRIILGARSKKFKDIFTKEDSKDVAKGRCELQNMDAATMDLVLRHIYGILKTDAVRDSGAALELLLVAQDYGLPALIAQCVGMLQLSMTNDNLAKMLVVADKCKITELRASVLDRIAKNRREFLRSGQLEILRSHNADLLDEVLKGVPNRSERRSVRCGGYGCHYNTNFHHD